MAMGSVRSSGLVLGSLPMGVGHLRSLCASPFFKKSCLFLLRWVFIAAHGLSLVVVSRGYSSLWCMGFSLQGFLSLWSTGSRYMAFSSCGIRAR